MSLLTYDFMGYRIPYVNIYISVDYGEEEVVCGGSVSRSGVRVRSGRGCGEFFGLDPERMGPGAKVAVALSVLVPVALSGVILVVFVPNLWWILTTYFWISFPALGMLGSGVAGLGAESPARVSSEARERELLVALGERGEIFAAGAATDTSMTVAEADEMLRELAEAGHLEVRVRNGGLFYALWNERTGIEETA